MSDAAVLAAGDGLLLDPFEFHGHTASCIVGLGGDLPNPDPHYAFHTNYVAVARGHAHFNVRFSNLRARFGTLWLRVHMLPSEPGSAAHMVTSARMQLNRLVLHGGDTSVKFEAYHGATYALMGVILDRTDAAADGLAIHLDRPFGSVEDDDLLSINEAAGTTFGTEAVKRAAQLISLDQPTFALPVSQSFTPAQVTEPEFKRWPVPRQPETIEAAWTYAYLLQTLDLYGVLQQGARGLVIGDLPDSVARVMTERGVVYENVGLSGVDIRPAEEAAANLRQIDPANLRSELVAFDFLCSICVTDRFLDESLAGGFVERSMECLRPGGLAVHVVTTCADVSRDERGMVCFDRNGIERIGLGLVSRGHDVARLKPPTARTSNDMDRSAQIPFGLIARRARSIL